MSMIDFVLHVYPYGAIGSLLSILYTCYCMPLQAFRIWQVKNVEAIPAQPLWIGLAIAFHIGVEQFKSGSYLLMIAMTLNFLASLIMLLQIYYYNSNRQRPALAAAPHLS